MSGPRIIRAIIDLLCSPLMLISALWMKFARKNLVGFWADDTIIGRKILNQVGVFPIIDHYYEPLFTTEKLLASPETEIRALRGINWNIDEQLKILSLFNFNDELLELAERPSDELTYSFSSHSFGSGDAEYLYGIMRLFKPARVVEVGCGHSTLVMQHAIERNRIEDESYTCDHLCIEPYANKWLERLPVRAISDFVENVNIDVFAQLKKNDVLFIDSSHIIRPQGDVLFEYLEVLPALQTGVLVHIHDVFTPRDYSRVWTTQGTIFWNEQYLLEAFLCFNDAFKIVGALNYLKHKHYAELSMKCPLLSNQREPGSFWIQKTR